MSATKLWRFRVRHHEYGETIVDSIGPESATAAAARVWDAPWREVAGFCRVDKLGPAAKPRCRRCGMEFGEPGDCGAYCPTCTDMMEKDRQLRQRFRPREDRRAGKRGE